MQLTSRNIESGRVFRRNADLLRDQDVFDIGQWLKSVTFSGFGSGFWCVARNYYMYFYSLLVDSEAGNPSGPSWVRPI